MQVWSNVICMEVKGAKSVLLTSASVTWDEV